MAPVSDPLGDIATLQKETELLLAAVHRPSRTGAGGRASRDARRDGESSGKNNRGKRKRKKRVREETMLRETLPAAPAHQRGLGRETVEVLDTLSNPGTPRDFQPPPEVAQAGSPERHSSLEKKARDLDFDGEQHRVLEGVDTFVPAASRRLEELDRERRRLEQIMEAGVHRQEEEAGRQQEVDGRREWLAKDRAAQHVQRVFRGGLGRQRVHLMREKTELEEQARQDWVEVRDDETGDVWYFNHSTGESQWEMPEPLQDLVLSKDRVKKLPTLSGHQGSEEDASFGPTKGDSVFRSQSLVSLPSVLDPADGGLPLVGGRPMSADVERRAGLLPDIMMSKSTGAVEKDVFRDGVVEFEGDEGMDEGHEELEGGISSSADVHKFFLADGSANVELRDTVRDALKVSRFDSVATLLMGGGGSPKKQPGTSAARGPGGGAARAPLAGSKTAPRAMVSVVKLSKSAGAGAQGIGGAVGSPKKSSVTKVKDIKSLSIRDVKHPGFDLAVDDKEKLATKAAKSGTGGGGDVVRRVSEICFNCWSSGKGKYCALHLTEERAGALTSSESALMCKNWNLGVMQKRYRSEEIQEVFMKSAASLRFDRDRKRFVTVEEFKHPVYRGMSVLLSKYNFTFRRKLHQEVWLRSLVEGIRTGKLAREGAARSAGLLRLRNTLNNTRWVRQYSGSVDHLHPKGPVTGTTLAERRRELVVLITRNEVSLILLPKRETPVPEALYTPRRYDLPAPRAIPMPRPSYKSEALAAPANHYIEESHPGSWFERMSRRLALDAAHSSVSQVLAVAPLPEAETLRRTKYPTPQTVKFATFARKPTPGNLAVGGLAAELTIQELVQTVVPAQFGDYIVMHRTVIAPTISAEVTAWFEPSPGPSPRQLYVARSLQHALNLRRPPTIMVPTSAAPEERHWYGRNRPEQTGEELSHGFRTTAFASESDAILVKVTKVTAFEPSAEVATPNLPAANQTVTTHVDHTYPFCEPSNRNNTTLDFYHLLLFGTCAPNKEQVFTNFSTQLCGEFMKETDITKPLGHCQSHVYRSWAFVQRHMIEEFLTDDGLPYWYDRRTGETFWERPLAEEEKKAVKDGGTKLDASEPSDGEPRREDLQLKYRQDDVRKVILRKHESTDEMLDRRRHAAQSAKWAREQGVMPGPPGSGAAAGEEEDRPFSQAFQQRAERVQREEQLAQQSMASSSSSLASSAVGGPVGGGGSIASRSAEPRGPGMGMSESISVSLSAGPPGASSLPQRRPPSQPGTPYSAAGAPGLPNPANLMADTLTQALASLLPQLQQQGAGANPADLLQLGMGLGMSLQAQGLLSGGSMDGSSTGVDLQQPSFEDTETASVMQDSVVPSVALESGELGGEGSEVASQSMALGGTSQPIGLADPTRSNRQALALDHAAEEEQQAVAAAADPNLTTEDRYKGIAVVAPTETPDEQIEGMAMHESRQDEARRRVPVFAYPADLLGKDFTTHPVAGVGTSFVLEGEGKEQDFVAGSKNTLRRMGDVLPEGFFQSIHSTHIGKAEVDYLPTVPNLPQPRPVGRVKPRSAAEDWFAIGFDPWSAGKDPLSREFVPSLTTKEEGLLEQSRKQADEAFIEVLDKEGLKHMENEASQAQKLAENFAELASWTRHGKYREIEDAMNQPDYNLPVDYQDDLGNSLLHIAVQNGNKRIAKLMLRRGAAINKQNLTGQTVLHYSHSYGFMELFQYLMSKGADDSLRNADGLTCYEGLDMNDVQQI